MSASHVSVKSKATSRSKSPSKTSKSRHQASGAPVQTALDLLDRAIPDARCELFYKTPYQLLVSVVLSAQTTDVSVNRCMEPLWRQNFGPREILALGEEAFRQAIRTIGLAPTKAKNVIALTRLLLKQFGDQNASEVPRTREELESLPGVGRKTASVILGEIYGEPTLAVDTHVFRVSERLGWHHEKDPSKAEGRLLKFIPPSYLPRAHHLLILHGRRVCQARKPSCRTCVLESLCPSRETTS